MLGFVLNGQHHIQNSQWNLTRRDLHLGAIYMKKIQVPIWEKSNLTIDEASSYFHIGAAKLREMTDDPEANYVLEIGTRRLIKRKQFEKYLENKRYI